MNFLAHLYLSGNCDGVKIGNFIGDWVKGSNYNNYPADIKNGILLHRKIDSFTDSHKIFKQSSLKIKEKYKRYSFVVTDIFYDHFLANNWDKYHTCDLNTYASDIYKLLTNNYSILPLQVQNFLPRLIQSNRLVTYKTVQGIREVLTIMAKYNSIPNEVDYAIDALGGNYQILENEFTFFFDDTIKYIKSLDYN